MNLVESYSHYLLFVFLMIVFLGGVSCSPQRDVTTSKKQIEINKTAGSKKSFSKQLSKIDKMLKELQRDTFGLTTPRNKNTVSTTKLTQDQLKAVFKGYLTGSGIELESVRRSGGVLYVEYYPNGTSQKQIAQEIGQIGGAYAGVIKEGLTTHRMEVTALNPNNGTELAYWYEETEWAKQFSQGILSKNEWALKVLGTLEMAQ